MIHSHCEIDESVWFGQNVTVWHYTNIAGQSYIGDRTVIGSHCSILGNGLPVIIGADCRIQGFAFIPGGTRIGHRCFIAPRVTILNDKYPPTPGGDWQPVTICDDVVIGGGAVILPGVEIGDGAKIGAGAVVTKSVRAGAIVAGNPAKEISSQWRAG